MRDGYAFRQHVMTARRNRGLEMIPEFDLFPVTYFTNHLAVTGPGEVHVQDHHLARLDFELEVAIVTGRPLKNATLEEADAAIFGYMVMNDWSARYLQMEEMKLSLGPCKGKDFATSLGPWLVTKDELALERTERGELLQARMTCEVNGHRLSDGNVASMNWTFAQILQRTSYGIQMQAGEVIGSGTVGTGCLLELNGSKITDNLWLKAGDEVVMEIEGLGRLVNTVVHTPERLTDMPPHLVGGTLPNLYATTPSGETGD
jgi:fumarylacetoacetate (FAA) hydrolase